MTNALGLVSSSKIRRRRRFRHTVLWVDDDPNIAAASSRRLARHSIRVIPASDGMQGYWYALTRKPDAIVTDLRMPRWRGEDLVDCLVMNSATRGIPTILLSGYLSDLDCRYESAPGIEAVLEKPTDLKQLISVLRTCWRRTPESLSHPA